MKRVELYGRVRHAVMIEGLSQREAARCFGIDPRTVRKMLSYSAPPGYVRTRPPVRPKLDPFIGIIDRILEEDKDRPKKQRHTSKRIPSAHRWMTFMDKQVAHWLRKAGTLAACRVRGLRHRVLRRPTKADLSRLGRLAVITGPRRLRRQWQ